MQVLTKYPLGNNSAFIGELGLDGEINPIEGATMVISMRELNIKKCIVPYENR